MSEPRESDGAPFTYVSAAELDRAPLRMVISPIPTTLTLVRDALQDGFRGTPEAWRKSILSSLRPRDIAALAPLGGPQSTSYPSGLTNVDVRAEREPFEAPLERLTSTPGSELLDALDNPLDCAPTQAWDPVRRDPDRWLRRYVDAMHRAWRVLEPRWRRSVALLEREQERLDAAMDRGVSPTQFLKGITPRSSVIDGTLRMAPAELRPRPLRVDALGVTVVPLLAGAKSGTQVCPRDVLEWIGYSLPEVWRVFDDQAPPPASLEALLGIQRSALLRRLDHPQPAGQIAQALGYTPSGVSFHLRALEAAGLIIRQQSGRNVIVQRTARGTQLLALYAVA